MLANAIVFRLDTESVPVAELADLLERKRFVPCSPMSEISVGWAPVLTDPASYVCTAGQRHLFELKFERKSVPAGLIKRLVAEEQMRLEREEGIKLGRKGRVELKERIYSELLPRAFPRQSSVKVWIDLDSGILGVGTSSVGVADLVVEQLAHTFEGLKISQLHPKNPVSEQVASWLFEGEAGGAFEFGQYCELKGGANGGAGVRYKNFDLVRQDLQEQLREGLRPTAIELVYDDAVSFVLTSELGLRKLDVLDIEQKAEGNPEDRNSVLASVFAIEAAYIARIVEDLLVSLGGEDKE